MGPVRVGILHYSAPPVIGGVESVIGAHARLFHEYGYQVQVIAGRGEASGLPEGVELAIIPEMDTRHPAILAAGEVLESGSVPENFGELRESLYNALWPLVTGLDVLIIHNVLTKHFNLPLTAALFDLIAVEAIRSAISWVHDLTWTSENSRGKVFPGYPWGLLRYRPPRTKLVTVSAKRQADLAGLLDIPAEEVEVIYNGVDPRELLSLDDPTMRLARRLEIFPAGLVLLTPVRVTQAKNLELAAQVLVELKQQGHDPLLIVTGPPDPHAGLENGYYQELLDMRSKMGLERELCFVYQAGDQPDEPNIIPLEVVGGLLRLCDVVFLPSRREGFGMPVLEAGLVGTPVVCSKMVPAGEEIGGQDIVRFDLDASPAKIARLIVDTADTPAARLRRKVRRELTWERIFEGKIRPLIEGS